MRALSLVLVLALGGCFYGPEVRKVTPPTYAGRIGGVQFDKERVSGVDVLVGRSPDGVWVGRWRCNLTRTLAVGPLCPISVSLTPEGLALDRTTLRMAVLRQGSVVVISGAVEDTVFRRADGQRIPEELVPPLWIALMSAEAEGNGLPPDPEHSLRAAEERRVDVQVEGVGVVEVRYAQPLLSALDWLDEGR
jgi:hypothetical protein